MVGSSESCQPWHRQAAILQPVCRGHMCCSQPFPVSWELLRLLQAIPLSGKWWLCCSGSLAGGSPRPTTSTSLCLKPQCCRPQCQERLLLSDRQHVLPCGYWHAGRMG